MSDQQNENVAQNVPDLSNTRQFPFTPYPFDQSFSHHAYFGYPPFFGHYPYHHGHHVHHGHHSHHSSHHPGIIHEVQACEMQCESMITHLSCMTDVNLRAGQLQLLRDCADICTLTAKCIARHSPFAKACAQFCASICEACAAECMKFPDQESRSCAQICIQCAKECRAFAAGK